MAKGDNIEKDIAKLKQTALVLQNIATDLVKECERLSSACITSRKAKEVERQAELVQRILLRQVKPNKNKKALGATRAIS